MKPFIRVLSLVFVLGMICISSVLAASIASYTSGNYFGFSMSTGVYSASNGESFTTPDDGIYYDIDTMSFYIQRNGSSCSGSAEGRLYSISGTYGTDDVPATLLATSDSYDLAAVGSSAMNIEFEFSDTYTMSPNTHYFAIMHLNSMSGCTYISMGRDNNTNGYSGSAVDYSGGSWTNYTGYDVTFSVTGTEHEGDPEPEPLVYGDFPVPTGQAFMYLLMYLLHFSGFLLVFYLAIRIVIIPVKWLWFEIKDLIDRNA